jgi:hypothetical protein
MRAILCFLLLASPIACGSADSGGIGSPAAGHASGSGGSSHGSGAGGTDGGSSSGGAGGHGGMGEGSGFTCSGAEVAYSTAKDLLGSCGGGELCHGGLAQGFSLSSWIGVAASECKDLDLVAPGDPEHSYIIRKLTGTGMCSGVRMPKVGGPLPPAKIQQIYDWICEGAPVKAAAQSH